ncbi:MAG: FecR domain-containing protein [Pseudomonadota bacterium]
MTKSTDNKFLLRKKLLLPFLSAAIAMLAGALIFIVPPPVATQFHETKAGQYKSITVTPDITVALDANTVITVTNSEPPKVELIQGNVYFDSKRLTLDAGILEIIVGDIRFWNRNANFSLQKHRQGGSIAVTQGQLEINLGNQTRQIGTGQLIDFDNEQIIEESAIIEPNVAPWRRIQ